ncbi:MAG: hypothetical protein ABH873_06445 [Candidatus Firestonebacteria bacterium]
MKKGMKNKNKLKIVFYHLSFVALFLIFITNSYGAFNIMSPSARVLGMGNSFVAVADDVNSIYANPAGLGNLKSWEVLSSYSKLYWGISNLSESFICVGVPFKEYGSVGVGWYNFNESLYNETVFYLAYAYPIKDASFGINFKYLIRNYVSNEWVSINPYFTGLNKSNFSFGLSLFTSTIKDLSFGLFIDDINQPDVGILEERLPMVVRSGVRYNVGKYDLVTTEVFYRNNRVKVHLGVEDNSTKTGNFGILSFRIGGGAGSDNYMNFTVGLGYKFNIPYINIGGEFDYGFLFPLGFASGTAGTHKFSLTIRDVFKELSKTSTEEEIK